MHPDDIEDATRAYREACEREKTLLLARGYGVSAIKLNELRWQLEVTVIPSVEGFAKALKSVAS